MELRKETGRWMIPMTQYLQTVLLPDDEKDARKSTS